MIVRQGEIYLATLEPRRGSEQGGIQPVVVVSGDTMNEHFGIVIVCPISTKIKNYDGCVQISRGGRTGLANDSEAITFQIRTLAKERFLRKMGIVSPAELKEIFRGLFLILTH